MNYTGIDLEERNKLIKTIHTLNILKWMLTGFQDDPKIY